MECGIKDNNCHFFGGDLKLDVDPRVVVNETAFESVRAVMRFAANLGLSVLAVAEGTSPQYAFMKVLPDGQAIFLLPGSERHAE